MDATEVTFFVDYILADFIPFTYEGKSYSIRSPSKEVKVIANEAFFNFYEKAVADGVLDTDQIYKLLLKYGIWDDSKEELVAKMNKEVEEMKVAVFENYLNTAARKKVKLAIKDTKQYLNKLYAEKHTFDGMGAEFVGNLAKHQILLGFSIYNSKNKPLWKNQNCFNLPANFQGEVNKKLERYRLGEEGYRELACSDYWRSIWGVRKGSNLFGRATCNLTDPQKYLISWASMYENVYKSSECPPDEIVNDFDALDGWMIVQRQKRQKDLNNRTVESGIGNEKIRNSDQIFVLTDEENIEKVFNLNTVENKIALNRRLKQLKRDNIVQEANFVDTRLWLRELAHQNK